MTAEFVEPNEPIEEPAHSNLDPESVMLHAQAIIQNRANAIDERNRMVHDSANRFERSRQHRKLGRAVDEITHLDSEVSKRRAFATLKNTAIVASTGLGIVALTYGVERLLLEPWLETSIRYFGH